MTFTCTSPANGIPPAVDTVGPGVSSTTLAIARTGGGGIPDGIVDTALVYNLDRHGVSVPPNVVCQLARSPGGHWYVASAPGFVLSDAFPWAPAF